ncbi:hypothetical protein POTOM_041374 [Populus tomentosa]|uniref:caffeate O-methyltransferase n=1 Tax=Populus tomentosa TaxID=118781 RepID=A0A8X7YLQ7_POPTO|nr:hypothetical protein POTOM_041374 [Populus tomentosa]
MATSTGEEDYHLQYAMQLSSASVLPLVLKAAIELGVFEKIEKAGPDALLSASDIVAQFPTQNNPEAHILLDPPVAKYFTKNQDGGSLSPFLAMIHDKVMMDMWYHLKDAVLEGGIPFEKAHGINSAEYLKKDARFCELFRSSMKSFNVTFMETILDIYDGFEGVKCLVDVGGGNGSILDMIITRYPAIKGINYDLASVVESSPSYPGIEHVAGDGFVTIPKGGDAIFMKWITHNWDDEHLLKMLKNCYEALPDNGKVIVVDMVVPETPETNVKAKSMLQNYLFITSMSPQGKERTEKEFETLGKEAGFSHIRVACFVSYPIAHVVAFQKLMINSLRTQISSECSSWILTVSAREISTLYLWREFWMYGGFEGVKTLVDVGGDDGSVLNMIISNYPTVKGINYDLAQL